LKRYREARCALEEYLAAHPDDPDSPFARLKLGEAFCGLGMFEQAIESFKKVSDTPGLQASIGFSQLGFVYYDVARYEDALEALNKALEIDPANLDAIQYTGMIYLDEGDQERAESCFQKILTLNPSHTQARYYMGYIYFSRKEFEKALPLFESVVRQEPDHLKAHYQLAQTYFRLNDPEKGRQALETYKKLEALDRSQRKEMYLDKLVEAPEK
jgi:tetratricopeptide (TPR) repeat protein